MNKYLREMSIYRHKSIRMFNSKIWISTFDRREDIIYISRCGWQNIGWLWTCNIYSIMLTGINIIVSSISKIGWNISWDYRPREDILGGWYQGGSLKFLFIRKIQSGIVTFFCRFFSYLFISTSIFFLALIASSYYNFALTVPMQFQQISGHFSEPQDTHQKAFPVLLLSEEVFLFLSSEFLWVETLPQVDLWEYEVLLSLPLSELREHTSP